MPVTCAIGLGSNLGDPRAQLARAFEGLSALPGTRLVARSSLYQSVAVGPTQPDYLNACALLHTSLEPLALLDQLQAIEQAHKRERLTHWGPRTLDLDLLLYGNQRIDLPRLTVPHAYLCERNFVLYPLHEIYPQACLPDGRTLASLLEQCTMKGLSRLETDAPDS
ncbi:2-amino-4-hydroxy-6-hydroxymethyldihydropteridine diphosphokinase [Simiduia sp. 21SJ11W-1]|uniref:2-amino-4-hydroxy-6- hydroxymethyldihydropteridine diphosphokinase n=1 Tax=Simiduia sp. 21SJ11W-1 TaxID=2909669 RepID=UPI00209CB987|nr:2-amino-4-hydroxy-6-hydroxymethyldihydropteridine diphosphokinase [Simiduia sp. 21SJ11W-1]UTA48664.1 2-amino-4-hydroxy-6-hydroxymethyldihydropteridine diphosphokinase [Simiduia sp. 21SJ11W-1]